jgi:pectate lyase
LLGLGISVTQIPKLAPCGAPRLAAAKRIAVTTLALVVTAARATLYLSEPFDYPAANLATAAPWSGAGANLKMIAGNLTNAGLVDFNPANHTKAQGLGSAADGKRTFHTSAVGGPAVGGSIYVSFLLRQTTLANSSGPLLAISDVTTVGSGGNGALVLYLSKSGTEYRIGVKKSGSVVQYTASGTYAVNDTVLVVARYQFNTASSTDDTVTLWINPVLDGVEPAPGATDLAATTVSGATDYTVGLQYLHLRANSSTASGVNEVDNIRVGSTWADVTPSGVDVPPALAPQPRITESFLAPGGLVLRGTNGVAGGVYQVLSSPGLAAPMTNWPPVATNRFDANGNFDSTNPASPADAQRFYRLLVGGTILLPPGDVPEITLQPTNLTVLAGQPASFYAAASGTVPLVYQWFFNTNTAIAAGTSATLTITNAQNSDEGAYSLRVTNGAGAVTSVVAALTVNAAPTISSQPAHQSVLVSNAATFSVVAAGDVPLRYQWYFNTNTAIANATNAAYSLASALTNDAGSYSVIVTNQFGAVTSGVATLTVNLPSTNTANFSLYGFGAPTAGGGNLPETDANYRKVYTPGDLLLALDNNATKIIEIMNDLNLGWNEIGAVNQDSPFRQSTAPSLHPVLIASGVTTIDIQNKNGLTIFSANGATIRHAEFNVKRTHNVLIRNLKFDELWEWDEADRGDYDSMDWDFITIGDSGACTNVWIDHCDFTKSYDGAVDIKKGANNVTISWCRFLGDDGGPDSFVRRQFLYLETNGVAETMFDFLRSNGFSIDDLVTISRSQKKGHLAGATAFDSDNADIKLTLHHNYYLNFQDRMPRLRGGNAHVYNCYANNTEALAAKYLRNARVAAMPPGEASKLSNGTYKFDVTLNGAISTEDGAVLVEKCHILDTIYPLRNNQADPTEPNYSDYTGKIRAEDTIYTLNGVTFRGNTEDVGSPLVPVPAALKAFSWNGFTSLPYSYPVNDPATIAGAITNHAGQGVIFWAKTNWFRTTY